MPDIDPAALSRPDPVATATPASLSLSKPNGVTPVTASKAVKAVNNAQRIDLEPLYTSLKSVIGENWAKYKEAISLFILGAYNQNELSLRIDYFVAADPSVEHLHNQLIAGIYGNLGRDAPEPGVALWVSANDKPTVVSKPVSGDAAEQRLKTEVMQLPSKDRRRLKAIPEQNNNEDPIASSINEYRVAKSFKNPSDISQGAGGLNRTSNWELEIKKRYSQPLASETGEFPDAESIQARMLPICFEEALPNGCAPACAEFMATATEQFMKEVVGFVFSRTRSNIIAGGIGNGTVMTRKYRQQFNRESAAFEDGKLTKAPMSNLLPLEMKEAVNRLPLGMGDFRVALELGAGPMGQMPAVVSNVMTGYPEGVLEGWAFHPDEDDSSKDPDLAMPLVNGNSTNGTYMNGDSEEDDLAGWQGGGEKGRKELFSTLDDLLSIGR